MIEREDALIAGAAQANKVVDNIVKESQPKFDTIINVTFTYIDGGRWHSVEMNMKEYLDVLQTGIIEGKQICAMEVSTTNADNDEEDKIKMIYDFVALHTGKNPWRMV
jgi:hypothetical protein